MDSGFRMKKQSIVVIIISGKFSRVKDQLIRTSSEIKAYKTPKSPDPATSKWHRIKALSPDPTDELNAKLDAEEKAVAEKEDAKEEAKSRFDHWTSRRSYLYAINDGSTWILFCF